MKAMLTLHRKLSFILWKNPHPFTVFGKKAQHSYFPPIVAFHFRISTSPKASALALA